MSQGRSCSGVESSSSRRGCERGGVDGDEGRTKRSVVAVLLLLPKSLVVLLLHDTVTVVCGELVVSRIAASQASNANGEDLASPIDVAAAGYVLKLGNE